MKKKCKRCIIAFHIGHGVYTEKEYKVAKKVNGLDCCGGTMVLNYCPICGRKIKGEGK